jgi:hypothetical protein
MISAFRIVRAFLIEEQKIVKRVLKVLTFSHHFISPFDEKNLGTEDCQERVDLELNCNPKQGINDAF